MRLINLFGLLLFPLLNAFAQVGVPTKHHPFQVVYANNAFTVNGNEIKSLSLLSSKDIINVRQGGVLAMVHFTGFPIEISTDSTFLVANIDELIYPKKYRPRRAISEPVDISYLFETTARINTIMYHHFEENAIDVVYPPLTPLLFDTTKELCIEWNHVEKEPNLYKVELYDLSNNLVKVFDVDNNTELHLDSDDLKELNALGNAFLLIIKDSLNPSSSYLKILLKKHVKKNIDVPYLCKPGKALYALMTALNYEIFRPYLLIPDRLKKAEEYYNLATILSGEDFYIEMLSNFKKRNGR